MLQKHCWKNVEEMLVFEWLVAVQFISAMAGEIADYLRGVISARLQLGLFFCGFSQKNNNQQTAG